MKESKTEIRNKLVDFAIRLGFTVELDAQMLDHVQRAYDDGDHKDHFDEEMNMIKECRPAGDCNYAKRRIRVREGKSVTGQVCTLIHELTHALGLGGNSWYSYLGEGYNELACESVTQFVSARVGIDRTNKTAPRIWHYGFNGYLATPVTTAIVNIFCDELGYDRFELPQIKFQMKPITEEIEDDIGSVTAAV